ncbi:hypothetical protein EV643_14514 [Kribbella sp. VKM Ac-2527]|uniref:Uncharacterized protein n=2 Tax=Kribbella caucasensis TaxID=2512215 RepID=A0A4R6J2Y3_9ACTN|nr:hypothetical protein EV643_14514 [Kribbella sp. VKM Ac-2527]
MLLSGLHDHRYLSLFVGQREPVQLQVHEQVMDEGPAAVALEFGHPLASDVRGLGEPPDEPAEDEGDQREPGVGECIRQGCRPARLVAL